MKKEYTPQDYELDRKYVQAHDALQNPDVIGKLEVLREGPGQKTLFVGLPEVSLRFLSMETAYKILDKPGTATSIISDQARRSNLRLNPGGGLSQLVADLTASVHRRVNELFDKRYRGARARTRRYEREHSEIKPPKKPEPKPRKPVQLHLFPNLNSRFEC